MFFEECPKYTNIKGIEHKMEYEVSDTVDGIFLKSPIPFLGIADILYQEWADLIGEDFKTVASFTNDEDGPHPSLWTQAIFYYYLVKAETGQEMKEFRIREIKTSKNKDGSSQQNVMILNFRSEAFEIQKSIFGIRCSEWWKWLRMQMLIHFYV